eukprot:COSAG01_NODE_899_length_12871_cov_27.629572_13_plen_184_part_00
MYICGTTVADLLSSRQVMMRYCDGASFSGNNETTASYKGATLYWRGMRIREAMVADLLKKGLSKATDLMVSGCSAGGLATYLHTDQWCDAVPNAKCAGLPDSGFFLVSASWWLLTRRLGSTVTHLAPHYRTVGLPGSHRDLRPALDDSRHGTSRAGWQHRAGRLPLWVEVDLHDPERHRRNQL